MRCPACDQPYIQPEHIAPFYDQQSGCWGEAVVYICPACCRDLFMRQPLGSLLREMDGNADRIWGKGTELLKIGRSLLEKREQENVQSSLVKADPLMEDLQASETGAWAAALALVQSEKAGDKSKLDDFLMLYLMMCRDLIRTLKPVEFPYQAELLNLAKEEVKRCNKALASRSKECPDEPAPPPVDRGDQKTFQFGDPL